MAQETTGKPGRPRSSVDEKVFAATLATVEELGYMRATVDRIAAAAGIAKTTIYRRWPSKGALITACIIDAIGALPLEGHDPRSDVEIAVRWGAQRIAQPGVGAAFAGAFTDAVSDPELRHILTTQMQDPYRQALEEALGLSRQQVLFIVDVVIGTLLHRMRITGEPMADDDLDALVDMVKTVMP